MRNKIKYILPEQLLFVFLTVVLTGCIPKPFIGDIKRNLEKKEAAIVVVPSFKYQNNHVGSAEIPVVKVYSNSTEWGKLVLRWNGIDEEKIFSISLSHDLSKVALTCHDLEFKRTSVYYGSVDTTLTTLLPSMNNWGASFSPNGQYLVFFTATRNKENGATPQQDEFNLNFYDVSSGILLNKIKIVGSLKQPMDIGQLISWLPDNKRVVFSFRDANITLKKEQNVIAIASIIEPNYTRLTSGTSPISTPTGEKILYGDKMWYLRHDMFYDLNRNGSFPVPEKANKFRSSVGFDKNVADWKSMAPYPITDYVDDKHYIIFSDKFTWLYDDDCDCWDKLFYWPNSAHRYGLQTLYIENIKKLTDSKIVTWD